MKIEKTLYTLFDDAQRRVIMTLKDRNHSVIFLQDGDKGPALYTQEQDRKSVLRGHFGVAGLDGADLYTFTPAHGGMIAGHSVPELVARVSRHLDGKSDVLPEPPYR
ncbi:MAG: hypothetical protein LRZ85_05490 [Alphaproteobacteria bacterium]|nr:hypothetical protein [Alphaproteobacteria bacterium]MCD8520043.1 hypothetical protein [Alphaproteobacteria bacterium]MCD8569963.1 hypothetical protein [Alphaproteobacteria bacterium]